MDLVSVSRSLHQLCFCVWYLGRGQRAHHDKCTQKCEGGAGSLVFSMSLGATDIEQMNDGKR